VSAGAGRGGGIYLEQGQLSLSASALYANAVPSNGGGLFIGRDTTVSPYVTVENSTIANNQAYNGAGGGVYRTIGSLKLTHVTIVDNSSNSTGGGIHSNSVGTNNGNASDILLANSIVTGNSAADSFFADCSDSLKDGGYNLQWSISNPYPQECVSGISKADPKLAPYFKVGGPTPTFGLLAGSPAIDAIPAANCLLNRDQRGVGRPINTRCDIGAFEGAIQPPNLTMAFSPATVGLGGVSKLTFSLDNSSTAGTVISAVAFKDDLPAGLKVAAPANLVINCTGTDGNPVVQFSNNGSTINVANASLVAGQPCTISVDLVNQLTSPGILTNQVISFSYLSGLYRELNLQAKLTIVSSAPTALTAAAVSSSRIHLTWQSGLGINNGFRLERSLNGSANFLFLTNLAAGVTTYEDNGLTEASLYYYRVSAIQAGGNSPFSNQASAITWLNSPVSLTATLSGPGQVTLNWQSSATAFEVERKAGLNGTFQLLASPATLTYLDSDLNPSTIYFYRVRAFKAAFSLYSGYSNEVSLLTPGPGQIVTHDQETGSGEEGSLLAALNMAAASSDKTITFNLAPAANNTVTVNPGVSLAVGPGITIFGGCANGPGIIIKGGSLQLKGNVSLYGLKLTGSLPGGVKFFITNKLADASLTTGNQLFCVAVGP
jgi:hypothetical protein